MADKLEAVPFAEEAVSIVVVTVIIAVVALMELRGLGVFVVGRV
jgi:hypothetical protein